MIYKWSSSQSTETREERTQSQTTTGTGTGTGTRKRIGIEIGDALTFDTKTEGLRLLLFVANTSQAEDEASDDCAVVLGNGTTGVVAAGRIIG